MKTPQPTPVIKIEFDDLSEANIERMRFVASREIDRMLKRTAPQPKTVFSLRLWRLHIEVQLRAAPDCGICR